MSEKKKQGVCYIISTPIGNLEDMTLRGIRILKEVDFILCEDTRTSIKLLNHYEIKTKMVSYHKFNEKERSEEIIARLCAGENAALITDAGTPLLSDPGSVIVKEFIHAGIEFSVVPGANAILPALIMSGLDIENFTFVGFLPKKKSDKVKMLKELEQKVETLVFYESPHAIVKTLRDIYDVTGDRPIAVAREITKLHEEVYRGDLAGAMVEFGSREAIKGEFVIVLGGKDRALIEKETITEWEDMSVQEHYQMYVNFGHDKKKAIKEVAKDRGIHRRDVYDAIFVK